MNMLVDFLRATLFATAQICNGSLGVAILAVSFALRLLLLPLSLRIARRAQRQQATLKLLGPELKRLQTEHAADPARLWRETAALYQVHDIRLMSVDGLLAMALQWPILGAFFAVVRRGVGARVRFLWIGDLARPDHLLVGAVTALAVVGSALLLPPDATRGTLAFSVALSAVLTLAFLWFASSTLALSYAGGSMVALLQGALLRRELRGRGR